MRGLDIEKSRVSISLSKISLLWPAFWCGGGGGGRGEEEEEREGKNCTSDYFTVRNGDVSNFDWETQSWPVL